MPPVAAVLAEERTAEEVLLEDERTAEDELLLLELRELELTLLEEERTAELLLLELRELLLLLEERFCWTEVLLRELPLLELRVLLPEDRVLEEPEPVDRLLEEELVDLLPLEERVWATMFSDTSMERTSIREVANETNFLIASQFLRLTV